MEEQGNRKDNPGYVEVKALKPGTEAPKAVSWRWTYEPFFADETTVRIIITPASDSKDAGSL